MRKSEVHINQAWILMAGLTVVITITAFVKNKLAAVLLGPSGIGFYAQGVTFLAFAVTFCTLGMGQGIVKHLAEREHGSVGGSTRSEIIAKALRIQLAVGLSVAGLVMIFSRPLARFLFGAANAWKYVVVVGSTIPLTLLFTNFGYFLQGLKRVREFAVASALNAVSGLACFVVLVVAWRLPGAVLSLPAVGAAGVAIFWLILRRTWVRSGNEGEKTQAASGITVTLLKYGGVVFISAVLETLSALLLRTWIVNYSGAALNGIYQAVLGLSGQYMGFFMLFNNTYLYPRLSSIRSPEETTREINHALRTGLLLVVPLVAGIITFRHQLILLLFTREFLPASNVLVWQTIGDLMKISSWFVGASLLPRGRLREYVTLALFFSGLYLFLAFTFLRSWSLLGLALAYCLNSMTFLVVLLALQAKLIGFRLSSQAAVVLVASAALLFGVVWLPDSSAVFYIVKVGLVGVWFLAVGGPRWAASAIGELSGVLSPAVSPDSSLTKIDSELSKPPGEIQVERDKEGFVCAVSVIVPVRNEAATVAGLIAILQSQTYRPEEIVIADGGSTDETIKIVRRLQTNSRVPIVLVEDRDAFPGRGRNLAIKRATNDWIACVDAGVKPEPNWLQELVKTSANNPDRSVIQGRYEAIVDSYFTQCAAIAYVAPRGSEAPSAASCLLHRSAWEAANGFPENLRSGEDLIFFQRLKNTGADVASSKQAIAHWDLQPDLATTFRRFVTYSRYGMKAGLASQWQLKVSLVYLGFLILLGASWWWWPLMFLPIVLLIVRAGRRISRWYAGADARRRLPEILNPRRLLTVAGINFVIDLAMFIGMLEWLFRDLLRKNENEPDQENKV